MLNGLFVTVSLISILLAASSGRMEQLTTGVMASASDAVELAIGLVGTMAFFLGLIRIAQDAGLMTKVARGLNKPIRLLFPSLPPNSPAIVDILPEPATPIIYQQICLVSRTPPHRSALRRCKSLTNTTLTLAQRPTRW